MQRWGCVKNKNSRGKRNSICLRRLSAVDNILRDKETKLSSNILFIKVPIILINTAQKATIQSRHVEQLVLL